MGFVGQLFVSIAGGVFGGFFVVIGVNIQSRRQEEGALRALLVELVWNQGAAFQMVRQLDDKTNRNTFDAAQADPGRLRRSVWESQLVNVVSGLGADTLTKVMNAYATLETVPGMIYPSAPGTQSNVTTYAIGGWINEKIRYMNIAFRDAADAVRNIIDARAAESWLQRIARAASFR